MKLDFLPCDEDHRIAKLAALAIGIHVLESAIPSPLPGVKPGLANVVTLLTYFLYGWRAAIWVSLLRVVIGSVIVGTFFSPTFMLSVSGALGSLAILAAVAAAGGLGLSPIGVAVLASLAHMAGQFAVAYAVFVQHPALFALLPVLMTAALVFGLVSGIFTQKVLVRLQRQ